MSTHRDLASIVGPNRMSEESELLDQFISGNGTDEKCSPALIVWPSSPEEVSRIVEFANKHHLPLIPVSSGLPRMSGSTTPKVKGSVIVDLGKMNRIIRVDAKNKVVMLEPGVTYSQLLPELRRAGLRPLMPLLPKASQSVLASCLDREPMTTPRFHWDASDPLLCTETVFGTGEMLRTGAASGPGTLEEQWASGQAQKNPMGPSQFDPFRLVQGSQGTIGIVTWISMKCEVLPDIHHVYLVGSDNLASLQNFNNAIIRRRLADEHFALNSRCLTEMLRRDFKTSLPEWILVLGISGHGPLAQDEFDYRMGDTNEIAESNGITLETELGEVTAGEVLELLNKPSSEPYWKFRSFGGCREVYFVSTLDVIPRLYSLFLDEAERSGIARERIGAYVQPIVQGVNTHCCFDVYYTPEDDVDAANTERLVANGLEKLMGYGAFFSRPPDARRKAVYSRVSPEVLSAMKRVKRVFDPKNILSPGNLCFEEAIE